MTRSQPMICLALLLALAVSVACDRRGPVEPERKPPAISLEQDSLRFYVGQVRNVGLSYQRLERNMINLTLRDARIAQITSGDSIVAVQPGRTWLIATSQSAATRDSMLVIVDPAPIVDCFFSVVPTQIRLRLGESVLLHAVGAECWYTTAVFRSSNTAVAEVSATGLVTGCGIGSTQITSSLAADSTKKVISSVEVVQ